MTSKKHSPKKPKKTEDDQHVHKKHKLDEQRTREADEQIKEWKKRNAN